MSVVLPINVDDRFRLLTASGGQTVLAITFPWQDDSDIALFKMVGDSWADLANPADYVLTGAGTPGGGSATLTTPAADGDEYLVLGVAVLDRLSSIVRDGRFSSKNIDDELDRNRIIQQEQARDLKRAYLAPLGSVGGLFLASEAGQFLIRDQDGNIIGSDPPDGAGNMNTAVYDPDLVHGAALSRIPVQPEAFGALANGVANDNAAILSAANFAVARNRPLLLTDGKTYLFQQLTLPASLVITGNGVLRSNAALTVAGDVTLTLGNNTIAESVRFSTPGTETNTDFMVVGAGSRIARLDCRADAQRAGGGVRLVDPNSTFIGYFVGEKIDRPFHFQNTSTTTAATGAFVGFLDIKDYVRGFRADFTAFHVGGAYMRGRSANASKSPGHNGVLIVGCPDWYFGPHEIADAGEHAFRIGGSEVAASQTKNYRIGEAIYRRPGGCGFKVNPTMLVSAGVTEKAENGIHAGYVVIDGGDGSLAGNEEIARITHVDGLEIGYAIGRTDNETFSGQYALQMNDAKRVTIGTLGGTNINAGFINIDGTSDVDGVATFGGDVTDLKIGRVFGKCAGNNGIAVNTAFNVGDISIGLDMVSGFATNLLLWSAGTVTDKIELHGTVGGSVAPALSGVPANDNFVFDLCFGNTRGRGARGGALRMTAAHEIMATAFDPASTTEPPRNFVANNSRIAAGSAVLGGGLEATRMASTRRAAAIVPRQGSADDKEVGWAVYVGDTNSTANEALLLFALFQHTGRPSFPMLAPLTAYADNAAATAGGLAVGEFYRDTNGIVRIRF
ncbi:hypothetical protein [Sinorhizobium fredii]|uniref:hypothetical protein n=1 Tax=Rhizobium fredii TaxID=380 RepID=UPI0035149D56